MLMHLDLSPTVLRPKKMCDKVLSFYNAIPDRFKTQEVCDKAVDTFHLYLILFLIEIQLKNCLIKLFLKILFC